MIIDNVKNKFNLVVILLIVILFSYDQAKAANRTATTSANTSATIVNRTIDIEELDSDFIFELSVNVDEEGNISDWVNKEKVISKMVSDPDTVMKVYYGYRALSQKDNKDNEEGFAEVILKNESGDIMKVKLKIYKSRIVFDKDGKGELRVNSEFLLDKEKQPKGNYKAIYYVIVSY